MEEIHHIAGEDGFLVKLWAREAESLGVLLRTEFGRAGARSTRTPIVLETILDRPGVPLDVETEAVAARRVA